MLKQLNAGIVSLSLMSTVAAPAMAQSNLNIPLNSNSATTENQIASDYSNLPSSFPVVESLGNLAVTNSLDFSDIANGTVDLGDDSTIAQRRTRTRTRSKYKYSAGLDLINFGWIKDENGAISSVLGFNVGLGVGYRKYFKPVKEGEFNFSWDVGTILLLFPFAGAGADYQWDSGWYAGGRLLVFPAVFFIDDFLFPVFPSLNVGYRWK
ncbi:MAG: hypothetical protein AAFO95_10170 [Cyanobacteria bacterium J06600_6]